MTTPRPIWYVIDAIMFNIPQDFRNHDMFVLSLESLRASCVCTAPELMVGRWMMLTDVLNRHINETDAFSLFSCGIMRDDIDYREFQSREPSLSMYSCSSEDIHTI